MPRKAHRGGEHETPEVSQTQAPSEQTPRALRLHRRLNRNSFSGASHPRTYSLPLEVAFLSEARRRTVLPLGSLDPLEVYSSVPTNPPALSSYFENYQVQQSPLRSSKRAQQSCDQPTQVAPAKVQQAKQELIQVIEVIAKQKLLHVEQITSKAPLSLSHRTYKANHILCSTVLEGA